MDYLTGACRRLVAAVSAAGITAVSAVGLLTRPLRVVPPNLTLVKEIASQGLAASTYKRSEQTALSFVEYLSLSSGGLVTPATATPEWVASYLHHFSTTHGSFLGQEWRPCKPGTVRQEKSFLARLFRGLGRDGPWNDVSGNPVESQLVCDFLLGLDKLAFNAGGAAPLAAIPVPRHTLIDGLQGRGSLVERAFFATLWGTGYRADEVRRLRVSCVMPAPGGHLSIDFTHVDPSERGDSTLRRGRKNSQAATVKPVLLRRMPGSRGLCAVRLLSEQVAFSRSRGYQYVFSEAPKGVVRTRATWQRRLDRVLKGTPSEGATLHGFRRGRAMYESTVAAAGEALQIDSSTASRYFDSGRATRLPRSVS